MTRSRASCAAIWGAGSAEDFFKRLTAGHGLVWYFDGSVLHVNSASELRTEVIDLGRILPTDVVSKLTKLGIADPRYPIRTTPGSGVVSVSGPPPYIVLVRQTLDRNGPAAGACSPRTPGCAYFAARAA